ncbi:MAG: archaellin/type IV pilin N-terminal domain-containing protein [archaeon]
MKRGISPVIATVLLVGMVIVIGLIIFLWFRSITQESTTKFGGKNIELVCQDISFEASYSDGNLYISNTGIVPIFDIEMKKYFGGNHETIKIPGFSGGLNQGATFSGACFECAGADKLVLIPVLLGESSKGQKAFMCGEEHGEEIYL